MTVIIFICLYNSYSEGLSEVVQTIALRRFAKALKSKPSAYGATAQASKAFMRSFSVTAPMKYSIAASGVLNCCFLIVKDWAERALIQRSEKKTIAAYIFLVLISPSIL